MTRSALPREAVPPSLLPPLRVGVHMRELPSGECVIMVAGVEHSRHKQLDEAAWGDYWSQFQAHLGREEARVRADNA